VFVHQGAIPRLNSFYGRTTGPIWLYNVRCSQNESSILNCTHNGIGQVTSFCDHGDDSGVECPGKPLVFSLKFAAVPILLLFIMQYSSSNCQQLYQWFPSSDGRFNFSGGQSGALLQQPVGHCL